MLEEEEKEDELRHRLLDWLSELDFDKYHERIYSRRHGDTGNWLVDSPGFKDWEGSKESSLLWCYGTPGVGKSVLASLVLETISARYSLDSRIGVAFVYFNFQEQGVQKSIKVLSTMIKQLARQKKVLPNGLKQFFKRYYRDASFPTERKLEAQLADLSANFDQVFLIMDALDEFEDRKGFLPIISGFAQGSPPNRGPLGSASTIFKIFVTSRREKDIEKTFTSCNFPTIQIEAKKVDADIETFIQYQLRERSGDVIMDQNLKDNIAKSLISKSSGMFLWIRYQLDYIYEQPSVGHIYKALDSLPPDMNATYIRILEKIHNQIPARQTIAQRALMWVVNAARPLKLRELATAVSIEPASTSHRGLEQYEGQLILDTCCNLLVVNDGIVRPVHYSVQEFLSASGATRADTGNTIPRQYQSDIHLHSKLAQICLQYLLFEELSSCRYPLKTRYYDMKYPFALYTARYWDYHVQRPPGPTIPNDLVRIIDKLLDSKGNTLQAAFYMRSSKDRGPVEVNPLNYCLAFNLLHLYELSHHLDASVLGKEHEYALHHAAESGSTAAVETLLGMGFSVHARDRKKESPLHYAVLAGRTAAAELLLDRGADINAASCNGETALGYAVQRGHEDLVPVLLERGGAVNLPDGSNRGCVLLAAVEGGDQGVVRMLLDSGVDVNLMDSDRGTALAAAAGSGHQEIVQMLLDSGADVNLTGGSRGTALAAAAASGHQKIVQVLLDSGANVNLTVGKWGTALAAAARSGHQEIVQMLLDTGADVNLTNGDRNTALAAATERGHQNIVQMLLDSGADVNITVKNDTRALEIATTYGFKAIAQLLLDRGAIPADTAGVNAI